MSELGKIKVVERYVTDYANGGKKIETHWEIFDGEKWIGKAFTYKKALRVSGEIKAGTFKA